MSFLKVPTMVHLPSVTAAKAQNQANKQTAQIQQASTKVKLDDVAASLPFIGKGYVEKRPAEPNIEQHGEEEEPGSDRALWYPSDDDLSGLLSDN